MKHKKNTSVIGAIVTLKSLTPSCLPICLLHTLVVWAVLLLVASTRLTCLDDSVDKTPSYKFVSFSLTAVAVSELTTRDQQRSQSWMDDIFPLI